MKKKRYTEEQIIESLREADAGVSVKELCRKSVLGLHTVVSQEGQVLPFAAKGKTCPHMYICNRRTPATHYIEYVK